jgi:methyl-accepting chemotaxis protein
MKKIVVKILLLTIGSAFFISVVLSIFMIISYQNNIEREINEYQTTLLDDFDLLIKSEVETIISLLNSIQKNISMGSEAREEAKKLAANLVREIRYGENGYFWIDTSEGMNVVLLGNESEGSNRIDLQDTRGTYIIRELISNALSGGGYLDYYFPKSGETESLPKRGYSAYFEPFDWVIGTGNYIDDIQIILDEKESKAKEQLYKNISLSLLFVLFSLFLVIVISLFLGRKITQPIIYTSHVAEKISKGNLAVSFDQNYFHLKDETGLLMKAFTEMIHNLNRIITTISASSSQVSSGAEQISFTTQQLSQGASTQASSIEEISSSMEELVSNIQQNQENASSANDIARKVANEAAIGGRSVEETIEAMTKIVDKIVIIEDIARNTNMLALNAAIEAARAGEAGKGFAVVAAEVKKLAENSGMAARDIVDISTSSLDIAQKAGKIINDLVPQIQQTSDLIENINSASQEQSHGAEQVNTGVKQLDQVIQQNAASSEELASMAEELSAQSEMMKKTVSFFILNKEKLIRQD